jgi:TolB-like protein/Tfp pilus assembly protein PilF
MGDQSQVSLQTVQPSEGRLDSWKEIASHLRRDVTTVQRWEKREGMPVHRHLHDKAGSVYAFISELDKWQKSRKQRLEELQQEQKAEPQAEPVGSSKRISHWKIWIVLAAVVGTLFVAVLIAIGRAKPPQIRSLAVLPLKNLSGDPTQEYLADGMTEAVISRLSAIHHLRVISRTSVMKFKDTKLLIPEIAKTLHVDAVVEGSIIRDGSHVRVHAKLIRGDTDEHVWSEEYDREIRDALALESDVSHAIARKVEVTVTGQELERLIAAPHPVSAEVYESYLRAKEKLDSSNPNGGIKDSIAYFQETISKDPNFAPAYVGLASAYQALGIPLMGAPMNEVRPKLISAAKKALELDPELAEPHVILGAVYQRQWRWSDAEAEYKQALVLNPNNASAYDRYAIWLLCQGRTDEALRWVQRGRELDPLGLSGLDYGWILFHARRYGEAIQVLRSIGADEHWYLGFALIANGQPDEAIIVLEKALSANHQSPAVIGVLIRAYAHAGRRSDAIRMLRELKKRQPKEYVSPSAFVNAYLGLGDNEQALTWLERAYQEQSNLLQLIKVHPFFDPLRDDPRFKEMVHKIGLD